MFVKITRFNEDNEVKELVVNTEEIAFLSETKPHLEWEEEEHQLDDGTTVPVQKVVSEEPRYLIGFKNGRHPQFISKETYEKLVNKLSVEVL